MALIFRSKADPSYVLGVTLVQSLHSCKLIWPWKAGDFPRVHVNSLEGLYDVCRTYGG